MFLDYTLAVFRFLKKLRESLTALILSALTSVFAGLFLGTSNETLVMIPGLILLVPAAIGMRGNIFAALGSRMGSALHLGAVSTLTLDSSVVKTNIYSTLTLTLILSVFLGFLAKGLSAAFGLESISVMAFVAISFIAGFLSGIVLLLMTFVISFTSYRRGWDPDNITAPLITAMGDFFTIPSLLFAAHIVINASPAIITAVAYAVTIAALLNMIFIFAQKARNRSVHYRKIAMQSLMVLVIAGILDGFAGAFVELNIGKIVTIPMILVMLPAFLETGGNIGNVLAARLGTKLHLGSIKEFGISGELKYEILGSMMLAYLTFPVLGVLTYVFSAAFGIGGLDLVGAVMLSTIGGFVLHLVIIFFTVFTAIVSFKYGFDPDNTTIPLLTSATDILGVIALLATLQLMAII